jgi:leucyl aminopeptidase (aminopeptidase T)
MKVRVLVVLGIACVALVAGPLVVNAEEGKKPAAAGAPDYRAIARQIVADSVQVKEQEGVVITGDPSKIALMEAVAVEVAKAGGHPHMTLESERAGKRILTEAPAQYLDRPNRLALAELKQAGVFINLASAEDPAIWAGVPEERVTLARKATQAYTDKLWAQPIRAAVLGNPDMPTAGVAKFYGVPLPAFEKRFWDAVGAPHAAIEQNAEKVRQALAAGREVHITTKAGTDLRMNIAGRTIGISDGFIHEAPVDKPAFVWLPAGEVFTSPDIATVNGRVVVPLYVYGGTKIRDLRLTFQGGRLTDIQAAQNGQLIKEALSMAGGDKDKFSFVDLGVNPRSARIQGSDYCSYEMNGMVTVGIGQAPWAGSPNLSEFGEAFFVPQATVEVDGRTIVKDGKAQI